MRNLIFYSSYYEAIKELPDEEQGKVYKAIIDYAMTKSEPNLSGIARSIFVLIKPTLDASIKNYENGKKGGRPPKETQEESENKTQTETQPITQQETQTITQSESETQSDIIFENENEKENDIENENDIFEKENSLTRVKESEETSPPSQKVVPEKKTKHKFGEYQNVLLTDEEHSKLIAEVDGKYAIEHLSSYREMKGYKCKSDYLAIKKWVFTALKEERQRQAKLNNTPIQNNQKDKVSSSEAKIWGN